MMTDYLVKSVFKTIQGEGPFAGCPAIFIRFGTCNLACPQCDTIFRDASTRLSLSSLAKRVFALQPRSHPILVVLTGGEPFQQPGLSELLEELLLDGYDVQIETNGTLYRELENLHSRVTIVCSPKTPKIHPRLAPHITAYKYLIRAGDVASDGLPKSCFSGILGVQGEPKPFPARPVYRGEVYLQPVDEGDPIKNKANLEACIASCLEHGYRLCIQQHKIIGME